jgi:hypothetical protein
MFRRSNRSREPRAARSGGLDVASVRTPTLDFCHRAGNERVENLWVKVRQTLEVQAGLAHLVFPQLGQELNVPGAFCDKVDDQLLAADREAGQTRLTWLTTRTVPVRAITHDTLIF